MGNENERTEPLLGFDVGLGLKMQLQQQPSLSSFDSVGGNNNTSHYERAYASAFPRSSYATDTFISGLPGKAIFTASQWQELERQKMIHKYMVASVPVPPQLLLSSVHSTPSHVSQSSNKGSSLDLRFSSSSSSGGSDQEPWRCKRTDGKKWRCSRDVLPEQKYCERHAHKSRTRSRKHVEATATLSPKNNNTSSDTTCSVRHLQQEQQPRMFLSNNTSNSYSNGYPTMASSASSYNNQTRCIEWFMRGDSISSFSRKTNNDPVSTCNQQWQQLLNQTSSSSRLGSSLTTDNSPNKNVSSASYIKTRGHEENKQEQVGFVSLTSYNNIPDTNDHHHHQTTTRRFIDAWENEGKKFEQQQHPLSNSLSLSMMSGGNGTIEGDNSDGILTTTEQWLSTSPFTWMNTNYPPRPPPPGGPLGEALCLGSAITTWCCNSNNANNDNSSSCSKSSCDEDGSNGRNCIGR